MAKKGQIFKKYSAEFKISVILDMREHHLGYCETARKYNLGDPKKGACVHTLRRWERIYLEEGAKGLMKERRGKNKIITNKYNGGNEYILKKEPKVL